MNLVDINGALSVERIGEHLNLNEQDLFKTVKLPQLEEEKIYYNEIREKVKKVVEENKDNIEMRRRLYATWEAHPEDSANCITLIQIIPNSGNMVAFLRSSSQKFISSDIGFLSNLALDYGCTHLTIFFGSFHTYLN